MGEVWRGIACGRAGSICTCNVARLGTRVGRGMVVCGWEGGGAGWAWPCKEGFAHVPLLNIVTASVEFVLSNALLKVRVREWPRLSQAVGAAEGRGAGRGGPCLDIAAVPRSKRMRAKAPTESMTGR